jgi:hypothetical protein
MVRIKKPKRGRPPKPEAERRSRNFTFRSRGRTHELLQSAASAEGRSISEEIERRIEQSFHGGTTTKLVEMLTGSSANGELLMTIGRALIIAENCLKGEKDRDRILAAAIGKIIESRSQKFPFFNDRLPDRAKEKSPDFIAFNALLGQYYKPMENEFFDDTVEKGPDGELENMFGMKDGKLQGDKK